MITSNALQILSNHVTRPHRRLRHPSFSRNKGSTELGKVYIAVVTKGGDPYKLSESALALA
jgi:hypothetical protein